jgi:enamine deaminase RidA (YjgF/YER057c/UK114 family)
MRYRRQRIASGSPWEAQVGYSRAVRAGPFVYVAGTTGTDAEGRPAGPGAYEQTVAALGRIRSALEETGASLDDVVRTRMYVTDIRLWPEIGRAHAEFFGAVCPAATMVEVRALIDPALVVEIEAEAIIGPRGDDSLMGTAGAGCDEDPD